MGFLRTGLTQANPGRRSEVWRVCAEVDGLCALAGQLSFSRKKDTLAKNFKKVADKKGTVDVDGLRQVSSTRYSPRAMIMPHIRSISPLSGDHLLRRGASAF